MRLAPVVVSLLAVVLAAPASARADAPSDVSLQPGAPQDVKGAVPTVAYAYSAAGAPARTVGAYAYGQGLAGAGQSALAGGGVTAWGSPVERLTLVVDVPRDVYLGGNFAPSAAALVRLLGNADRGWSLGALAKYKVEGFGTDPNGDLESEVEGGLLLSYSRSGYHLDLNTITGFGLTEEGEVDAEGRLRLGYDLTPLVRVGADGQARWRLAGTRPLPGNRTWDAAGGPQIMIGTGRFFGALTAGPSTMGIASTGVVGWTAIVSLGGGL
jgi:hypothetical protein